MGIRVVSKRVDGTKPVKGEVVINIARPSLLGNPFYMRNESQRSVVIKQYEQWLERKYVSDPAIKAELHALANRVKAGENLALECWCAPCACHGDVIVKAINWINKQ